MDDAQLVAAVLAGDRTAYAALYDRYADRIHDFGASILRNRADASDALQETFLIAFEALDALAQPARLRSWLYAIAHRAVLDRIEGEGRLPGRDGGQVGDLIPGPGSTEPRLSRAELAEFVWQAAGGLPQRDQILLDLHLRQGLEERDLAGAAGVPVAQLDPVLERLEAQSERALGALLVARTGRRSCPNLSGILGEWDGQLTTEFRDRVTAHVDDCEVCNSRRRIAPSPLGLLAATPMAPAPAYLRSVVLGKAELEALERTGADGSGRMLASAGWAFGGDGFPDLRGGDRPRPVVPARPVHPRSPPPAVSAPTAPGPRIGIGSEATATAAAATAAAATRARATAPTAYLPAVEPPLPPSPPLPPASPLTPAGHDRRGMLVGGLAGLIILIAAVVFLLSSRTHRTSGTVNVSLATTVPAISPTTVNTTTTVATTRPTNGPSTTLASVGHLIVGGPKTLDFGGTTSSASVIVGNDGPVPLDFTATASGTGLTVNPVAGTLSSGGNQTLTLTLERALPPTGPFTGTILIASPGGNAGIMVTAVIDAGPTISGENASAPLVYATTCLHTTPTAPRMSNITATVTGPLPLKVVVLHWQSLVIGATGTSTMAGSGTTYSGTLGPYTSAGTVDWWITAIDSANATGMSNHHTLTVFCSP